LGRRVPGLLSGAWGAVTGGAPHVLHHVGPLAGAAFLGGALGRGAFFVAGLALSVPLLRRLRRRTGTLVAPAAAVALLRRRSRCPRSSCPHGWWTTPAGLWRALQDTTGTTLKSPPATDTLGGYPKEKP
jgi:hypothetical protein